MPPRKGLNYRDGRYGFPLQLRNQLRCNTFQLWVAGGSNPEPTD